MTEMNNNNEATIDKGSLMHPKVTSSFTFDEALYKEYYVVAQSNLTWHMGFWGLMMVLVMGSPFIFVAYLIFISGEEHALQAGLVFLTLPAIVAALSINFLYSYYHPPWRLPSWRVSLANRFRDLKERGLLMSADYTNIQKSGIKEIKTTFSGKAKREAFIEASKPFEVDFHIVLDDEGIRIGKSEKPFISYWYHELDEVKVTKNLIVVMRKDGVDAVFKKDALEGGRFGQVYAFLKAKKKGKDLSLESFLSNKNYQ